MCICRFCDNYPCTCHRKKSLDPEVIQIQEKLKEIKKEKHELRMQLNGKDKELQRVRRILRRTYRAAQKAGAKHVPHSSCLNEIGKLEIAKLEGDDGETTGS